MKKVSTLYSHSIKFLLSCVFTITYNNELYKSKEVPRLLLKWRCMSSNLGLYALFIHDCLGYDNCKIMVDLLIFSRDWFSLIWGNSNFLLLVLRSVILGNLRNFYMVISDEIWMPKWCYMSILDTSIFLFLC